MSHMQTGSVIVFTIHVFSVGKQTCSKWWPKMMLFCNRPTAAGVDTSIMTWSFKLGNIYGSTYIAVHNNMALQHTQTTCTHEKTNTTEFHYTNLLCTQESRNVGSISPLIMLCTFTITGKYKNKNA